MENKVIFIVLAALLAIFLFGCAKTDIVDLNMSSAQVINDTKVVKNESRYADLRKQEEGLKEVPANVQEWLCSEKVLVAMRSCKINKLDQNNLDIAIKNNGFLNMTVAFYFYSHNGTVLGGVYNDSNFAAKDDWVFTLPIKEMYSKYGAIEKIHMTPMLVSGNDTMSCKNKILPILVEGCG